MTPDLGIISQQNTQDRVRVLSLSSGWVLLTKVCRVVVGRAVQTQIPQIWDKIRDLSPVHALSLTQDIKLRGRKRERHQPQPPPLESNGGSHLVNPSIRRSISRPAYPLVSQLVSQPVSLPTGQSASQPVIQPASH